MRKLVSIFLLLLCTATLLHAGKPRLSYGLEWGYSGTFLKTSQHNYICSEGYRIVDNPVTWRYFSNGSVLGNVGVSLNDNINLSVYSGLLGVYSKRWMVPVELRARWCPSGLYSDGLIVHAGAAVNFPTASLYETGMRAIAGAGYRVAVFRSISVDLLISYNFTLDSETIMDPDTRKPVHRTMIETNTTEYQAVNISLAINF